MGFLDFIRILRRRKSRVLDDLVKALDDEIDWVKNRGSGKKARIYDGRRHHVAGVKHYYVFKLDEELKGISDDSPIELTVGHEAFKGNLVSITPNEIIIEIDRDLGERIESAVLLSQTDFILEALRKRLSSGKGFNRKLAEQVLKGDVTSTRNHLANLPKMKANIFQANAVRQAVQQSVSYIWGPPGTGKTWTIALLAYSLFQDQERTLILSNTNVAVDRALQMISSVLPNEQIIRIGNPSCSLPSNVVTADKDDETRSMDNWRIVGATLAKSFLDSRFESLSFDTVIVDEASMAQIPSVYHSAMLAKENLVIVGDFNQLPPIAMNNESAAVRKWLMRDIFEHVGISDNPRQFLNQGKLAMLRRQYRMHPQISSLINGLVYGGLLEDAEEVLSDSKETKIEPASESGVVLVDSSVLNPWCKKSSISSSKYNIYHTFVAVTIAEKILEQGRTPAIITPYTDQARRTRLVVRDKGLDGKILVSTVHRFQGQEVDTVIYDIPDSEGSLPRWLESDISKRLVNVAFSRAKSKLFVLANREFLNRRLSPDNLVRKAIQHIEQQGRSISADQFLPPDFEVKDKSARVLHTKEYQELNDLRVATFTETTFYPAFISDLENAKSEVVIFSPFITQRRLGTLAEDIRNLVARKVKLSVYTRPPNKMFETKKERQDENLIRGASDSIEYLRRIGATVNVRPEMHEKIAVIDLKTWWIGSLNIFSHAHTHEGMIRIRGLEKTIQNLIDEILERHARKPKIFTKINQLSEGMKGLNVEGTVAAVASVRKVRSGKKVSEAFLSDGTGTVKLVLWEDQIKAVKEGMTVRIENCYVSSYRGSLQLVPGMYGRIIPKPYRKG